MQPSFSILSLHGGEPNENRVHPPQNPLDLSHRLLLMLRLDDDYKQTLRSAWNGKHGFAPHVFYYISCLSCPLRPLSHHYKSTPVFDLFKTQHRCCDVTAVNSMCVYLAINSCDTKLSALFGERKYKQSASKGGIVAPCMCVYSRARTSTRMHGCSRGAV